MVGCGRRMRERKKPLHLQRTGSKPAKKRLVYYSLTAIHFVLVCSRSGQHQPHFWAHHSQFSNPSMKSILPPMAMVPCSLLKMKCWNPSLFRFVNFSSLLWEVSCASRSPSPIVSWDLVFSKLIRVRVESWSHKRADLDQKCEKFRLFPLYSHKEQPYHKRLGFWLTEKIKEA